MGTRTVGHCPLWTGLPSHFKLTATGHDVRQNATTPTSKSRSACPGPVVFLLTRSYKGNKFGALLRVHLEPIGDVGKPSRQQRKGHLKETYGRVYMDEMYHFSVY